MKKVVLTLAVLTLVGCDIKNDGTKLVGAVFKVPRKIVKAISGDDHNNDTKQDQRLDEHAERIELLEFANELQFQLIDLNASNIAANGDDIEQINRVLEAVRLDISNLESDVDSNSDGIESLEGDLEDLEGFVRRNYRKLKKVSKRVNKLSRKTTKILRRLQRSERAIRRLQRVVASSSVEILNPCGDALGADEVLIKFGSQVVAYYKASGSREFLSVLSPNVAYTTTDGFRCSFKIDQNGDIITVN